jgi:hypothetical protein
MLDVRMPISAYMKAFAQEIDGKTWILVSIVSLVALIDVLAGTQFVPIREKSDFGKAVVLLVFTPLLSFLVTTMLRQLPFSSQKFSAWMRAVACLGVLLILNF